MADGKGQERYSHDAGESPLKAVRVALQSGEAPARQITGREHGRHPDQSGDDVGGLETHMTHSCDAGDEGHKGAHRPQEAAQNDGKHAIAFEEQPGAGDEAATGVLHPAEVMLWCIAGAIAGDAVSYWLGLRTGPAAWRHPLLKPRRRLVARARLFFRRYGLLSIILCRFLGPVRAFVPFIAGVTRMAHGRFQLANIVSAVIWVPVMLAPGYLAGKGFTALRDAPHNLEWILAAVVAMIVLGLIVHHIVKARKA